MDTFRIIARINVLFVFNPSGIYYCIFTYPTIRDMELPDEDPNFPELNLEEKVTS